MGECKIRILQLERIMNRPKDGNITLIGMPGVGKSTAGKKFAEMAKLPLLDTDAMVFQCPDCRQLDDKKFIELEKMILLSIHPRNSLIITGGSVVYAEEAMRHLESISTIIWLNASFETIAGRLGKGAGERGIVGLRSKTLAQIYGERLQLYEKYAAIQLNTDGMDENMVARNMLLACKAYRVGNMEIGEDD